MPATTYAISVNEETARQFEASAAAQGMEPSEVLCRLVREYVRAGGFANKAEQDAAESDALKRQADEWLTLRAASERQQLEETLGQKSGAAQEPQQPKAASGKRVLPWEDPDNSSGQETPSLGADAIGAGSPQDSTADSPALPWENPNDPALPWQQEEPVPTAKLPWQD